jgi:hypothetical protein
LNYSKYPFIEFHLIQEKSDISVPVINQLGIIKMFFKSFCDFLQLAAFSGVLPITSQNILHSFHVGLQFPFYLLGPNYVPSHRRNVSLLAKLGNEGVLVVHHEFVAEFVYVILHCFQKLRLVFYHCSFYLRFEKQ